jgi:hypothetical protein
VGAAIGVAVGAAVGTSVGAVGTAVGEPEGSAVAGPCNLISKARTPSSGTELLCTYTRQYRAANSLEKTVVVAQVFSPVSWPVVLVVIGPSPSTELYKIFPASSTPCWIVNDAA